MADEGALRRWLGVRLGRFRMYEPRELAWTAEAPASGPDPLSFAIVTAVRNQAPFIARTMRSVLAQRVEALDYVVKDAASTDGTLAIASEFSDARLRVVSAADSGLADGLNAGFAIARGDIMGYLNGDDMLLPGALALVSRYFVAHPEVDVVYGHRIVIDEMDHEVGRWVLPSHSDRVLSWEDYLPQETVFWRRRIWERAGARFDPAFSFAVDWDLWLRFRDVRAVFARIPRFLGAFRIHGGQKTAVEMASAGRREMEMLRRRSLGRDRGTLARIIATTPYLAHHALLSAADRTLGLYR